MAVPPAAPVVVHEVVDEEELFVENYSYGVLTPGNLQNAQTYLRQLQSLQRGKEAFDLTTAQIKRN